MIRVPVPVRAHRPACMQPRRLIAGLLSAAALTGAAGAHAGDLYGFVDETGRVHVTPSPPPGDTRYQLFLRAPDDYLLKETVALPPSRNPGDFRLRSPMARMQPDAEKDLKVPAKNIRTGVQYLAELLEMFEGDLRLAIAAYNAGENAVIRHGRRVPPYAETIAYVPRVLRAYEELRLK